MHDASIVCDPAAYRWRNPEWRGRPWRETVFYELHVGILGGFAGVKQCLPSLARLGITAVELMPIAEFPGPRNWGYDGVLPYAPDAAYGTPEQLKALVDTAHGLGMMMFLDVVYNHFGPDGNYLGVYAPEFFREDLHTPWGSAIDFRQRVVRDFFTENALYWLDEFRFDGLRLDAVHMISEKDWLVEMAHRVRAVLPSQRQVHLVLENDDNSASLLERAPKRLFDAQWNDDLHHAMHILLTGEREGYYAAYTGQAEEKLARGLAEGFIFQGEAPMYPGGAPRGEPCAHLPPTSFVFFLQNHDQIGNRAFGERLSVLAHPDALRAATALLLLTPQIPLLFMGDEYGATQPFLYFTSYPGAELAEAVREGRRREFAHFPSFADPARRERIPDPNAEQTFLDSIPRPSWTGSVEHAALVRELLRLRREHIAVRLDSTRTMGAKVLGRGAVEARWHMGDGTLLQIAVNLGSVAVALAPDDAPSRTTCTVLFSTGDAVNGISHGELPAHGFIATLETTA